MSMLAIKTVRTLICSGFYNICKYLELEVLHILIFCLVKHTSVHI